MNSVQKKFLNQEFLYGISSFCTLSENNNFLHGKISYFCIFLVKNRILNTEFSAMSHAIHKIVSIKRCQSYFISRRSPHLGISKDSELCASAHRCLHYAYARLIARVTFHLLYFLRNQFCPRHSKSGSVGNPLGGNM